VYGSLGTWSRYEPGIWAPTLVSRRDVAVNVLIYVPFGLLGFLSLRDGYRKPWPRLVARLVLLAALFSGANEVFQLYTIDRVASLTDIASAAVGALAGGVAIALWREPK
jgi:VanZ family protein